MKKLRKNIIIGGMLLLVLGLFSSNVFAATTANIEVIPTDPEPESELSFTATITSDETVQSVILKIQECTSQACFSPNDVTLTPSGDDYIGDFTLAHDDAVYIQYWLEITTDVEVVDTDIIKLNLKIDSNNGNGTSNDDNGSPGFELIILFMAIIIAILITSRKRL